MEGCSRALCSRVFCLTAEGGAKRDKPSRGMGMERVLSMLCLARGSQGVWALAKVHDWGRGRRELQGLRLYQARACVGCPPN